MEESPMNEIMDEFMKLWDGYPERSDGRGSWKPAFEKFRELVEDKHISPAVITRGAERYAASKPQRRFIPHLAKWLETEGWLNDYKADDNRSYAELADWLRTHGPFALPKGMKLSPWQKDYYEIWGELPDGPEPDLAA
jgi:hypothetical protein